MRAAFRFEVDPTSNHPALGAALVAHFAGEGRRVTMNYRDQAKAHALLAELERTGAAGRMLRAEADLTDRDQVRRMFDRTVATFARVDVLIN